MTVPSHGLGVRTLRTLEDLAPLADFWRSHQTHPGSDFDHFRAFLARQPEFLRPHVLVLEREGRMIGLVAGSIRRESLPWRIGSLTLGRSRARVLWVAAGGVLGESSHSSAQALTAEFLAALARGEADAAYLHQIDSASPLYQATQATPALARDRWTRCVGGWALDLAESYEAYFASRSRNVRRNLKRYSSLLERELGADFRIVCYREPAELERLLKDSEAIARLTYHRGMGVGFEDKPATREFFAYALAQGWLRAYLLYARGRAIAFWHGLAYRGTFYTRDTGYDPEFGELRPGHYLLNHVIAEHCRTRDTRRFDYGVMELEYKRHFGSERYERASVYLFSRRPRGLYLSTLRTASGLADRAARGALGGRARTLARKLAVWRRTPAAVPAGGNGSAKPNDSEGADPD